MKFKALVLIFVTAVVLSGCAERIINKMVFGSGLPERCQGRQWKNPSESLDCQYPPPPLGRWKAVYTKDFAAAHNLPAENVSTDFSPGVDYMEMETLRYGKDEAATACLVKMLIKKPHDASLSRGGTYLVPLPKDRKMAHLINLDRYKEKLKPTATFSSISRDYLTNRRGYRASTFAMYAEDVLSGYDYVSANVNCRNISMNSQYYPDGYAFWVMKASVWGRYENRYRNMDAPGRPKGDKEFDRSHFSINIPKELVSAIFDGVLIGGR